MVSKTVDNVSVINDDELLSNIVTFGDALASLESAGVGVIDSDDLGSGFKVMDKATLVGVPFLLMGYRFADGDHGDFAVAFIVTEDDRKGIIVDGSTGIYQQLKQYSEKGMSSFLMRNGLTRSDYQYDSGDGKMKDATTFYLST
jgi:hypothetical protein